MIDIILNIKYAIITLIIAFSFFPDISLYMDP